VARTRKERPRRTPSPRERPRRPPRDARPAVSAEARRLSALAQLGELALDTELSDPLLDAACALVQQGLSCDAAALAERSTGGLVLRASAGLPPERRGGKLPAPGPGAALQLAALGFAAGAEVQLPGRVRPPLVLGAYRREARPLDGDAVRFLEGMARLLSAALARQRAEHDLLDRERLLLAAFEARPEPELLVDKAGAVHEANTAACRLLAQPRRAVVGRSLLSGGAAVAGGRLAAGADAITLAVSGGGLPVALSVSCATPVSPGFTAVRLACPAEARTGAAEAARPRARPGPRSRVLVVDDEPLVGTALARTLGDDHEVTVVAGAAEALTLLDAGERFDAILSDLLMPGMTGLELYRVLAVRHPSQARRLAFLTGVTFEPEVRAFLEAEAVPWLEKPFELVSLRALLAQRIAG
jgi:CheY-like chemotaxis protein/PAS domain-containing protein